MEVPRTGLYGWAEDYLRRSRAAEEESVRLALAQHQIDELREALATQTEQHKVEANALAAQCEEVIKERDAALAQLRQASTIAEGAAEVVGVETQAIGALAGEMEQALAAGCGYAFAMGQSEAQVEDVNLELTHVRARAEGAAREVFLKSAGPARWGDEPGFDMLFSNAWAVPLMADSLASMFVGPDAAPNYVEARMDHPEVGPLVMRVQKCRGKTPNELRQAAERALAESEATAAAMREALKAIWLHQKGLCQCPGMLGCEEQIAKILVPFSQVVEDPFPERIFDPGPAGKALLERHAALEKGWADKLAAEVEDHERTRKELGSALDRGARVQAALRHILSKLGEHTSVLRIRETLTALLRARFIAFDGEEDCPVGPEISNRHTSDLCDCPGVFWVVRPEVTAEVAQSRPLCAGCNTLVDSLEAHALEGCPGEKRGEVAHGEDGCGGWCTKDGGTEECEECRKANAATAGLHFEAQRDGVDTCRRCGLAFGLCGPGSRGTEVPFAQGGGFVHLPGDPACRRCDHSGIGLPMCPIRDPRTVGEGGPRPDPAPGFDANGSEVAP